jgi:hypothetical protein
MVWAHESEIFKISSDLHGLIIALPPEAVEYYEIPMEPGTYFVSIDGVR